MRRVQNNDIGVCSHNDESYRHYSIRGILRMCALKLSILVMVRIFGPEFIDTVKRDYQ